MEYVIFPMKVINITQRHYVGSHTGIKAIDIAESSIKKEAAYAPTTCKVLNKRSLTNTVFYGTSDQYGNPAYVDCEDGHKRILTYALTHSDNIDDIYIGQVFRTGEKFYTEGSKGEATGNHIHLEVAEGWVYEKQVINGYYQMPNAIFPHQIFYQLKGWNTIKRANGYTFIEVDSREVHEPLTGSGYYLEATRLSYRLREEPVSGKTLATLFPLQTTEIMEFLPIQSDGYQWAKVNHEGLIGYSQIDTKQAYTIRFGIVQPQFNLFQRAMKLSFKIRTSPVNGDTLTVVFPKDPPAKIISLLDIQSDGYQWAIVEYQGISGFAQIDTFNAYVLELQ